MRGGEEVLRSVCSVFFPPWRRAAISAALIHRPENMRYLTGFTGEGCLFVSAQRQAVLTDFRYVEQAVPAGPVASNVCARAWARAWRRWWRNWPPPRARERLAVETDFLCYDDYAALQAALGDVPLTPLAGLVEEMRLVKDEGEIDCIRRAADIACRAFKALLEVIRPGMTEREVAIALNYEMLKLGSEGEAFDTIACAGLNGSLPHAVPGEHRLQNGELLTLDFGATYNGYRSDMTRTVGIGKVDGALKDLYQTVLEAHEMALDAVRPGAVCEEVDKMARDFIEARYPGAFGHALGHGVGLYIHEQPRLGRGDGTVLRPGHVVTIEPGIYISGLGGCRIEDMAILTSDGFIDPIDAPKQLIEL